LVCLAYQIEIYELLEIFGFFLLALIGVELLETIKAYIVEKKVLRRPT
jgi:hypothetical protein